MKITSLYVLKGGVKKIKGHYMAHIQPQALARKIIWHEIREKITSLRVYPSDLTQCHIRWNDIRAGVKKRQRATGSSCQRQEGRNPRNSLRSFGEEQIWVTTANNSLHILLHIILMHALFLYLEFLSISIGK